MLDEYQVFQWDSIRQIKQLLNCQVRSVEPKRGDFASKSQLFIVMPDGSEHDLFSEDGIATIMNLLRPHFEEFVATTSQHATLVLHDVNNMYANYDLISKMQALGCTYTYTDAWFGEEDHMPSGWFYKGGKALDRQWGYWIVPKN